MPPTSDPSTHDPGPRRLLTPAEYIVKVVGDVACIVGALSPPGCSVKAAHERLEAWIVNHGPWVP